MRRPIKTTKQTVYCPICKTFKQAAITDKAAKSNKSGGYPYLSCILCMSEEAIRTSLAAIERQRAFEAQTNKERDNASEQRGRGECEEESGETERCDSA